MFKQALPEVLRRMTMERYQYPDELRALLENNPIPFAIYQFINRRVVTLILTDGFCELFGYKDRKQAYRDMDHDMYKDTHHDDVSRIADAAFRFATDESPYDVVYRTRQLDGTGYKVIHAVGRHIFTKSGVRLAYVAYMDEGLYTENTDMQSSIVSCELNNLLYKETLRKASWYDHLTGLPSMTYFFELADAGKAAIQGEGGNVVMLFFDFCGMKYYNTKYGFSEGDKLLLSFAKLLADTFSNENCCRIAADHFAVYCRQEGVEGVLTELFESVYNLNVTKPVPVHVGIYVAGTESVTVSGAFDRAKMACDSLKNRFESCFAYYRKELISDKAHRQYILSNLDRAIEEKWIQVYYQGIVRAVTGKVSDEEALARWIDPEKGMLSPAEFIPYLEDAGLLYKLDLYVLEQVLEKIQLLKEKGLHVIPHSINLSRSDFDACDIVEEICRRVDDAGVSRDRISIEITESTIGSNFDFIKKQIERFRELGFPVWMDDFGSGYSSFDVLQSVRFDLLKFDMSFMRKLDEGENGKIILSDLMRMATKLGLDTICEGVETEEQVRFLQEIGCAKLQGYYFSTPVPLSRVLQIVDEVSRKGLENPEEEQYYQEIGRTNLYDFSADTEKKGIEFQNVFNTLPMGILELDHDSIHYIRSNQSYRDYMKRYFHLDISGSQTVFTTSSYGYNPSFFKVVKQCCQTGNPMLIDEPMRDGSMVHSFIRRVGVNPAKGTAAVAIAVLSVTNTDEGTTYSNIARALAVDYYSIYYVDIDTEKFLEYSLPSGEKDLALEKHGENFFSFIQNDAMKNVYEADRAMYLSGLTKEGILREIEEHGSFTQTYRLIDKGSPVYANMKISRLHPDGRHLIAGVSIIDAQVKQKEILDRIEKEQNAMMRVIALTDGYLALYTIDSRSDHYVEYTASKEYESLGYSKMGTDFFHQGIVDGRRTVWAKDLKEYLANFSKRQVMEEIRINGKYKLSYHLVIDGRPEPVSLIIVPFKDGEDEMLLAGVKA